MYKTGVYFGKFIPPHLGHLHQIINAATKCEKLYVVLSDHKAATEQLCKKSGLPVIDYRLRKQWLSQETQDLENVEVLYLDESEIPIYPNGWIEWTQKLIDLVPNNIDAFFVGESEYVNKLHEYFPEKSVILFDPNRSRYNISATKIRENPLEYWDYIVKSARPFFCKKVLIAGTESCGKTTLCKYLAKIYNTTLSEEVGRYYASKFLGGDESIFSSSDFGRIAHLQYEQDQTILADANKVCFFDTDAVATNYFSKLYLNESNTVTEKYIDPYRYDVVLYLEPDVDWVNDGMRLHGTEEDRDNLSNLLYQDYVNPGFNVVKISGNYNERLDKSIEIVDKLIRNENESWIFN